MKRVLVIAYHFPPGGGPGVQRVLKHVTYLRQAGWEPVVLTVEDGDFPARDESLLAKVPTDVPVHRVPIYEPYKLYRKFLGKGNSAIDVNVNKTGDQRRGFKESIAEWIRATVFIPDARVAWLLTAVRKGVDLCKKYDVDAIYSSSPPYTCALIARAVKRRTGLPWVAGFRDPWTDFLTTPKRWFLPAAIDRSLERSVFREADGVECAWTGIIDDALRKYPDLDRGKFEHIPNGYDSADFPNVQYVPNQVFTITYTGSMYGRRTPKAFLGALELLAKADTLKPSEICLQFIGRFGDEVHDMMDRSIFSESILRLGYVPHSQSIAFVMKSEASLLIVDDAKESAEIVPGKVYEYLGIGRPIIAIAPKGSAIEELITRTNSGMCAPSTDLLAISRIIGTLLDRWRDGTPLTQPDTKTIEQYERRNSAQQLATLLTRVSR